MKEKKKEKIHKTKKTKKNRWESKTGMETVGDTDHSRKQG